MTSGNYVVDNIFDIHSQKYDNWFLENQHAYLTELLALKKEIFHGKKGVDIGIGTARFAQMLNIPFGIDISYPMLKIAKDRGCEVAVADAGYLPFRTNEFDYALLMVTLCFVEFPKKVIKEAKRILAKKGKLVIGIIDKKSHLGKSYLKKNSVFYKSAHFYSAEEVIALLKSNKFTNIKMWQTLFKDPEVMNKIDKITEGYGDGGFTVISAMK